MPEAIQETCLHVVSRCDHPIKLADYGFIDATGELQSIVMAADLDPLFALQLMQRGSSTLSQRGAQYEAGYTFTAALPELPYRAALAWHSNTAPTDLPDSGLG